MNTDKTSLQVQNDNTQIKLVPANLIKQEIIKFEENCCDKENNADFDLSYGNIDINEFDIKDEINCLSNSSEFLRHDLGTVHLGTDINIVSMKHKNVIPAATDKCVTSQLNYKNVFSGSSSRKKGRCSKRATRLSQRVIKRHRGKQTQHQLLQCDYCSHSTPRRDHMLRHMLTHSQLLPSIPTNVQTEKKLVYCQDCKYSTHRKDAMARHALTHLNLFPYACSICSFMCNEAYGLKRHQATSHKNEVEQKKNKQKKFNYVCEVCGFSSQYSCNLYVHKKTHDSHLPRQFCQLCPFSSCSLEGFRRHSRRCPGGAPARILPCPSCAYSTTEIRHLRRHRKTHLGTVVNTHQCVDCGEYFNSKSLGFHQKERCKGWRSK